MSDSDKRQEPEFSPAAKAALDEVIREIGTDISWRAAKIAHRGEEGPTLVSALDVAMALQRASFAEKKLQRRIRSVFYVTGLYGIVGLALMIFSFVTDGDGKVDGLPTVGALLTGAAMPSIVFWLLGVIPDKSRLFGRSDEKATPEELYHFLGNWISLETAIRAVYSGSFGDSRSSLPVVSMIARLNQAGIIDASMAELIRNIRELRNDIVHKGWDGISRRGLAGLNRDTRFVLRVLYENFEKGVQGGAE